MAHLREAPDAYGGVLGLTAVREPQSEPVALRDPLAALSSALRRYVVQVIAYRSDDKPTTGALAERLLHPLATWASKSSKTAVNSEPAPPLPNAPTPAAARAYHQMPVT